MDETNNKGMAQKGVGIQSEPRPRKNTQQEKKGTSTSQEQKQEQKPFESDMPAGRRILWKMGALTNRHKG